VSFVPSLHDISTFSITFFTHVFYILHSETLTSSGQAWDEFCDTLKAAGAAILADGAPKDALTQAEGYRYLARLVRGGLENFLEASDPNTPTLVTIVDGYRAAPIKIGSDNPDNLYESASIVGSGTYKISGTRGSVKYLGFGTQAGVYGKPGGLSTVDYVDASMLNLCKQLALRGHSLRRPRRILCKAVPTKDPNQRG
jgi:hypothetical protein